MTVKINQNCHANENLNQNKEVAEPTSNQFNVSPSDIIPLPKISEKRKLRNNGKRSEILSGTPYKEALENAEKEKEQKKRTIEDNKIRKSYLQNNM